MLTVIMLSVNYAECHKQAIMLGVIMLNFVTQGVIVLSAIMLDVMAPTFCSQQKLFPLML